MKLKYLPFFLASLLFLGTSCSDDDEEEEPTTPAAGNYFPVITNSVWNYSSSSGQLFDVKASGLTSIVGGITFKELSRSDGDPSYYHKDGGNYMVKDPRIDDAYIFLKDNAEVGSTWSMQSKRDRVSDIEIVFTVKAISSSRKVGDKTYTELIHIQREVRTEKEDGEFLDGYIEDYYYGKNIGLVFSKGVVVDVSLLSYAEGKEPE